MKQSVKSWLSKNERVEFYFKLLWFSWFSLVQIVVPDKLFIRLQYRLRTGRRLNLEDPTLYNEKIQWLKLFYKTSELNRCVDKWDVRSYVSEKGLGDILVDAFGPYDSFEQINFDQLPAKFIIKLTNGSSFNIICNDKNKFDFLWARKRFNSWQKLNFFASRREWAYKDVANRIMCERLITNERGDLPPDYRFFCFDGEVKFIAVDLDSVVGGKKTSQYFRHLYTPDWQPMNCRIQYPRKPGYEAPRPDNLERMIEISKILSADFVAVRVDLYDGGDKVLFGELTFYHASGYQNIEPKEFELEMGSWVSLGSINND